MIRLVLLHGFLGRPGDWDAIREELGTRGVDVDIETPWLPGHGDPPSALAVGAFEPAVDAFAERLAREPAVWVGYSMGARIALGVAARRPAAIRGLVLVSSHLGLVTDEERAKRSLEDDRFARLAEVGGIEALAAAHEKRPVLSSQAALPACLQATLHARRRAHDPLAIASSIRALGLGAMPDLRGALASLRAPMLALAGSADPTYAALAREAAGLARGEAIIVEGAGHDVVLEDPEPVASAIASLVARVEGGTRAALRVTESHA